MIAVFAAGVGALAAGCGAPQASQPPPRAAAVATPAPAPVAAREVSGIVVDVVSVPWDGYPRGLVGRVTPIQVTLKNRSKQAVVVRYRDLALIGEGGRRYTPLAPAPAEPPRRGTEVFAPVYSSYGFEVAPDLRLYYPTFPAVMDTDAFPSDREYQQASFAAWPAGLPTQDMREHALPEGVLEKRGTVTGYLYFRDVGSAGGQVSLEARLGSLARGREVRVADLRFPLPAR